MLRSSKSVANIQQVIEAAGLKSGDCVSFHHHLRNGDNVLNLCMTAIEQAGLKNMVVNASAIFDCHTDVLTRLIENGTIAEIHCNYMVASMGKKVSQGILKKPVVFRTHGGRPAAMASGESKIDLAFIAAPAADLAGNISGILGPAACGSLGYAFADAMYAEKTVAVTDHLEKNLLSEISIPEIYIDYVVEVDSIGDPKGIVSGTTEITRDVVGLNIAKMAAKVIESSGVLQSGFSFQTGAGGISLAVAAEMHKIMKAENIVGGFGMGGITKTFVEMLESGSLQQLMDVQCFDTVAVESMKKDKRHKEISVMQYAGPKTERNRSSLVDNLDTVVLGATEVDLNFNVNVHTDSNGSIMGGSGGHGDTAEGALLTVITAPLIRGGMPLVKEEVACISTEGRYIDALVTDYGVAINPRRSDLEKMLNDNHVKTLPIEELMRIAERHTGKVKLPPVGDRRVIADIKNRHGEVISHLYEQD